MLIRSAALAAFLVALSAAPAARADTLLDLSETAHVSVQPDEIAASLRAEANAPAPAAAQAAVNRMMEGAIARAHQDPHVKVTTGPYSVWQPPPPHPGSPAPEWQASQTLDLSGSDGPAMLSLVGALQQQGLAVQQLGWQLSPDAARGAHEAALRKAIGGLRQRAEAAAALLGLHFASFKTVRLTPIPQRPLPMMRATYAMAAPAPSAEQGPVEVSATITAQAVLTPSPGQP